MKYASVKLKRREVSSREEERRILRDDVVLRGNSRGIGRLNRV